MEKIKNFFVDYNGTIGRIFINHIAMSIFGLLTGLGAYGVHPLLYWGAMLLGIGMYMFLLYMIMWELGSKESVEVEYGRMEKSNFKGLIISLVNNSLFILAGLVSVILSFFASTRGVAGSIALPLQVFVHSIYLPLFTTFSGFFPMLLIVLIPELVVSALSYWAGVSGKRCLFPNSQKSKK
jgi:hypothetical protein